MTKGLLEGREVTTGAAAPEESPVDYMTDEDWYSAWEYPEGKEELLPFTPSHVMQDLFGVDSYEEWARE